MMGDELFPSGTPMLKPFLVNLADNPIVVQFIHRWLAFLVAAQAVVLASVRVARRRSRAGPADAWAVLVQIMLGIARC
jgi:cytochrome c oxidase assembly protein subunit 15